jgi:N4-gp56 family major capsid protein
MAINTTATINTGTGSVATKPAAFYDKTLLLTLRQRTFDHAKLAQQRPMPRKAGDTINFRRIGTLAPALTPLTEGVTPEGSSATITAISATTRQYGDWMEFSDVVDFQQIDPIITEYTVEQGHQASETLDVVVREELAGGSNVFYAAERTSRATVAAGDIPTINDFRKIKLSMEKNHVKKINGKYVVLISPEVEFDLMDDPKFEKAYEIGQKNTPFIDGEIADVYGLKFVKVENAKVFEGAGAAGANVHASIVLGAGAYGITKIKGEGDVKSIVKALGSAGTADPLDQRQSIAWKVNAFTAKRLQELAITRYESVPTNA